MAHYIARWTQITVTLLIIGPAALAQTDYPLPGQPPIAQPTTTQPVTWRRAAGLSVDCGQDLQQFCYGVQPGDGRLIRLSLVPSEPVVAGMFVPRSSGATCSTVVRTCSSFVMECNPAKAA